MTGAPTAASTSGGTGVGPGVNRYRFVAIARAYSRAKSCALLAGPRNYASGRARSPLGCVLRANWATPIQHVACRKPRFPARGVPFNPRTREAFPRRSRLRDMEALVAFGAALLAFRLAGLL